MKGELDLKSLLPSVFPELEPFIPKIKVLFNRPLDGHSDLRCYPLQVGMGGLERLR